MLETARIKCVGDSGGVHSGGLTDCRPSHQRSLKSAGRWQCLTPGFYSKPLPDPYSLDSLAVLDHRGSDPPKALVKYSISRADVKLA